MCLRFTIRDLLWLTAVVAVSVCWWLSNRRLHQEYDENAASNKSRVLKLEVELEKLHGEQEQWKIKLQHLQDVGRR